MAIQVLDFSHSQIVNSFHEIAETGEVAGVIMKAGQGLMMSDSTYADRLKRAKSVGLLAGSYFFDDAGDGAKQADRYLAEADPQPDELICLDWETPKMSLLSAEHFVEHVHDKLDRWPKWYAAISFMQSYAISAGSPLRQCGLWIARYGPNRPVPMWEQLGGWLWQVSGDGVGQAPHMWPGVVGAVDRSVWQRSAVELRAWWAA